MFSAYTYEEILALFSQPVKDKIFYFRNKSHSKEAPPHYHVALPINSDEYILLVMFTSQVDKIKRSLSLNKEALECLFEISPEEWSFLTKPTVINCNLPTYLTKEELCVKIDGKVDIFEEFIPDEVLLSIKKCIKKSPLVKPNVKKKIL